MKARIVVHEPNGGELGPLPAPMDVSASFPLGDVGALSLDYAEEAPRAAWLDGPKELALEVSHDGGTTWAEQQDARYLMLRRTGDQVKRPGIVSREAKSYRWRLCKARVLPNGLLNTEGKRPFLSATPGTIMATLIQEAQTRGALEGMAYDFTTTHDSAGEPWAKQLTIYYEPGLDYLAILTNLEEQGVLESATQGRTLRLFNADAALARDLTVTAEPVVLRHGRDVTEAPYKGTLEDLADYAYLAGDEGYVMEYTNPTALAPWGRQETFITQGGVSDPGTATILIQADMERGGRERMENTYGLQFAAAKFHPFRDYRPGDYVLVKTTRASDRLRVRQVTLAMDEAGNLTGNAVLNDRFLEAEVRQARRVSGISGGSTASGGSGASPAPAPDRDTRVPKAPVGVQASSLAYIDTDGAARAQVTVSWDAVTLATNNTALELRDYQVQGRTDGGTWKLVGTTDPGTRTLNISPLDVGKTWAYRVRANAQATGLSGAWSAEVNVTTATDVTPPEVPSTPTATTRRGVVTLQWDGLDKFGNGMAPDMRHVQFYGGDNSTPTTPVGHPLPARGFIQVPDQAYDVTKWYRVRAVDRSGNWSGYSVAVPVVVQPLVDLDLGATTIEAQLEEIYGDATAAEAAALEAAQAAADAEDRALAAQAAATAAQGSAGESSAAATAAAEAAEADRLAAVAAEARAAAAEAAAVAAQGEAATSAQSAAAAAGDLQEYLGSAAVILRQAAAPAAEYRRPGVLWIKDTNDAQDGTSWTWNTTTGQWEQVTDATAAQLAADADAAADAAAAAQAAATTAKNEATTAKNQATTAQGQAATSATAASNSATAAAGSKTAADQAKANADAAAANAALAAADADAAATAAGSSSAQALASREAAEDAQEKADAAWRQALQNNMLQGGDFETPETAGIEIRAQVTGAHSGEWVGRMQTDQWRTAYWNIVPVIPGHTYETRWWARQLGNASPGTLMTPGWDTYGPDGVDLGGDLYAVLAESTRPAPDGTWREHIHRITIPETTYFVRLRTTSSGATYVPGGYNEIDDVWMADVTALVDAEAAHDLAGEAEGNAQLAITSASQADTKAGNAATAAATAATAAATAQTAANAAKAAADAAAAQAEDFIRDPMFITDADDVKELTPKYNDPTVTTMPNRATSYGRLVGNDNWTQATTFRPIVGNTYRIEVDVHIAYDSPNPSGAFGLMMWKLTADGNATTAYAGNLTALSNPTTGWKHAEWEWTCPDATWQVVRPSLRAGSKPWNVTNFHVRDVTEAKAAKAAADAAQTTANNAATAAANAATAAANVSKNLFSTSGPSGTAPQGSTWFQVNGSGEVIGQWQQTATGIASTWTSRPIRSEVIANLDAGKLTAGTAVLGVAVAQKFAAETATFLRARAEWFQANKVEADWIGAGAIQAIHLAVENVDLATGQRLTLQPDGMRLFGPNDTGAPTISLTTGEAQTLALLDDNDDVAAGLDAAGGVVGRKVVATQSLTYQGDELSEILWNMPWGLVAHGETGVQTFNDAGESGLGWLSFEITAQNRAYRISMDDVYTAMGSASSAAFYCRWTGDGSPGDNSSPLVSRWWMSSGTSGMARSGGFSTVFRFPLAVPGDIIRLRFSMENVSGNSGQIMRSWAPMRLSVEDIGPGTIMRNSFQAHPALGKASGGSDQPSASPAVPVSTITKRRPVGWAASYKGDNTPYNFNTSKIYQGYSLASNGVLKSLIGFPQAFRDNLASSVEIEYVQVYILAEHWYSGTGGQIRVGPSTWDGQPSTFSAVGMSGSFDVGYSFKRGEGRWITLPAAWYASFKSGAYKGIALHAANSTSSTYYGYINKSALEMRYKYQK